MSDAPQPSRSAPSGTICATHGERTALATCPQCGRHACFACWHPTVDRCHVCLMHNPAAAAPSIPWEDPERGFGSRLFATLATAFRPLQSAPAFASPDLRPAVTFALITAVLPALFRGLIPYTQTMRFGPSLMVAVIGTPSPQEIALDVGRAMLISLVLVATAVAGLTLPLASVAKAYGERFAFRSAVRLMLYRAWLLSFTLDGIFVGLVAWALPPEPGEAAILAVQLLDLAPLILLISAMRATVRLAGGVGPFRSYLVVVIALFVGLLSTMLVGQLLLR